jgi:hypothetical protein
VTRDATESPLFLNAKNTIPSLGGKGLNEVEAAVLMLFANGSVAFHGEAESFLDSSSGKKWNVLIDFGNMLGACPSARADRETMAFGKNKFPE